MAYDEQLDFVLQSQQQALAELRGSLVPAIDPEAVAPFLWSFENESLGPITLSLDGDTLILETPEWSSELIALQDPNGNVVYAMVEPPLAGLTFNLAIEQGGTPVVTLSRPPDTYRFTPMAVSPIPEPTSGKG